MSTPLPYDPEERFFAFVLAHEAGETRTQDLRRWIDGLDPLQAKRLLERIALYCGIRPEDAPDFAHAGMHSKLPEHFGRFVPGEVLAEDSLSVLFRGTDPEEQQACVIELFLGLETERRDQLLAQARSKLGVVQPGLAPVLAADRHEDGPFVVYRSSGETAWTPLPSPEPGEPRSTAWIANACELFETLCHTHRAGTFHGHLSTQALLRDRDGATHLVGHVAPHRYDEDETAGLALAPELKREGQPAGPATDVWTGACLLIERWLERDAMTGPRPFAPEELRSLPRGLGASFELCLQPKPKTRPSAARVCRDLERVRHNRKPRLGHASERLLAWLQKHVCAP